MKKIFIIFIVLLAAGLTEAYSQDSINRGFFIEVGSGDFWLNQYETDINNYYPQQNADLGIYRDWLFGNCDTCITRTDWEAAAIACDTCYAPGDSIINKWLNNEMITAEDSVYLQLCKTSYMWPSYENNSWRSKTKPKSERDAFTWDVVRIGQSALRKGYRHEVLTGKDSVNLALYKLFAELIETGAPRTPEQLGISRNHYEPFLLGEQAPDFRAFKLETLLNSPEYSDEKDGRSDLYGFLSFDAVGDYYSRFNGYEPDGTTKVKEIIDYSGVDSNFHQLSKNLGDKPQVIIIASGRDSFFPRCLDMTEALKKTYGEKIDFLFVDIEIHDVHMRVPEYFGSDGGNSVVTTWSTTAEERAHTTKVNAMQFPFLSIPMCVDDQYETIRNKYYAEGGDGFFILLDKNGKVADQMATGWSQYNNTGYQDEVVWTNNLEKKIIKLIQNNGLYNPATTYPWPTSDSKCTITNRENDRLDRWTSTWHLANGDKLWKMANIVDIDVDSSEITLLQYDYSSYEDEMIGYNLIKEAGESAKLFDLAKNYKNELENKWLVNADSISRLFTFKIDNGVELFLNGEEVLDETSFKIGDFVNVKYDFDSPTEEYPIQVRASRYNFAPTINDVGDVSVTENDIEQIISLSGLSDGNLSNIQNLSFAIESSNIELIPTLSIENIGLDTAQLKFTPVGDKTGTSFISIKIKDDGGADFGGVDSIDVYFQINVLPVGGHMPTLDDIADFNIIEDASTQSIPLAGISDGDGGFDLKPIIVSSSDETIIPSSVVLYNTVTRTANITFTPVNNASGIVNMSVVIEDKDGLIVKKFFVINVKAINDKPTISPIDDVVIDQDLGLQNLDILDIYDGENYTQDIAILISSDNESLISTYSVKYKQGDDFAMLKYKSNAGKSGVANITITVKDNGGTDDGGVDEVTEAFAITVNSTTAVTSIGEKDILIYPNPVIDIINFINLENASFIVIRNGLGQVILNKKVSSNSISVDISHFKNGVYLVQVVKSNGKKYSKTILKL